MVLMPMRWPPCHRDHGITGGKTTAGPPRSQGQHTACPHDRFPRTLLSTGRAPALKEQRVALRLHGRGIRATARGLQSTPSTGMNPLKNKSRRSPRGPHRSATRCPLGPWTGCAGGRTKPQAMRGGLPWGSSPSHAGAGRPGRTALAPAWRRSVAAAQTRGCCRGKPCASRWASRAMPPSLGGQTRVISILKRPMQASTTRSTASAHSCPCGRGSRGEPARRSAVLARSSCMTSSLDCLSIAMSLGYRCETVKCKSAT
jgi:hypothetical protein